MAEAAHIIGWVGIGWLVLWVLFFVGFLIIPLLFLGTSTTSSVSLAMG